MNNILRFISVLALSAVCFVPSSAKAVEKLKDDPRIRKGTSGNGMTYYIVKNSAKKGYADFYLVQKGGMMSEDTTEAGITRFLQNMSLRGTRNFPDSQMTSYLSRIGVARDREIKVETYENGCVTGISDVPVGRIPSAVDSSILILYNWSYSLNLDGEDVEKEKQAVAQRLAVTDSPSRRIAEKGYEEAFRGGAFARQNTETQLADLQGFTSKQLRSYYYKWFTPDKQALVIAGDIDPAKIETYIKTLFSTIPKSPSPAPLRYAVIPPKDTVQFVILSDPGLKCAEVSLTMQAEVLNNDLRQTGVALIQDYMNSLCCSIFKKRLEESAMSVDFPVYGVEVKYGPYFVSPMADTTIYRITSNREALSVKVKTDEKNVYEALDFIIHETERIDRYGFSNSEYELANSEYWRRLNRAYYFRNSFSTNGYYAAMCVSNFLNGKSLASLELRHLYMTKINVPDTLYSSQINAYTRLLDNPERDAVITVATPSQKDSYDHDRLVGTYVTALTSPCDTLTETVADSALFRVDVSSLKKEVAAESRESITGATVWTLPNGAIVVCKNSDTTRGRFIFSALGKGGESVATGTAARYASELGALTGVGKVCGYDSFELERLMAGRDISLKSGMNEYCEYLVGEASSESLESFLRLVFVNFNARTPDLQAFEAYARNTGSKMTEKDYLACADFIGGRFHNASNFTFIFTGDIDPVKLKTLCESYIASLPADGSRGNWEKKQIGDPATDRIGRIVYKAPMPYGPENYLLFNVTRGIIDEYLCNEFSGGGMLVSAGGDLNFWPSGYALLTVDYSSTADDAAVRKAVRAALDRLAEKGVDEALFRNVVTSMAADPTIAVKDNDYWMRILVGRYLLGKNLFPYYEDQLPKLTVSQVDAFLRTLLTSR